MGALTGEGPLGVGVEREPGPGEVKDPFPATHTLTHTHTRTLAHTLPGRGSALGREGAGGGEGRAAGREELRILTLVFVKLAGEELLHNPQV